ncbi:unnamed protein product [Auanema sp. JU1783]|nr:unnamed protein product [Auanema sp. JU1783]
MDPTKFETDLIPDRNVDTFYNRTFDWQSYAEKCGVYPCTDQRLFRHVDFVEQTVLERICSDHVHIIVYTGGDHRVAKVLSCVGGNVLVEFVEKPYDSLWLTVRDVVTKRDVYEKFVSNMSDQDAKKYPLLSIEVLEQYQNQLPVKLNDLIQIGQFFEVQDPSCPNIVSFGEVKANMGGLILFQYFGTDRVGSIHILDPFCHEVGWKETHKSEQTAKYHERYALQDLWRCRQNPLCPLLFDKIRLKEHNVSVGMILEVRDQGMGRGFFPGHVSKILSPYFFEVKTRSLDNEDIITLVAHSNSDYIFPVGYSEKNKYCLIPLKWDDFESLSYDDTFWENYARSDDIIDVRHKLTDAHLCSPCPRPRIHPFQYVEVFCHMRGCMFSALITAATDRCIWVLPGQESNTCCTRCYSIGSLSIFPCGYAARYNIPLVGEAIVPTLRATTDRFNLSKYYSPTPGAVFSKRKGVRSRFFLSRVWLTGDHWMPVVYINLGCYHARYPTFESYRKQSYPSGPMFSIIQMIAMDFYSSVCVSFRQELRELFNCSSDVPNVVAKYRWRSEHTLLRVPVCEQVAQFPAWLMILLRALGCCPNFLSLKKVSVCAGHCQMNHVMDIGLKSRAINAPGPRTIEEAQNLYSRHVADRYNFIQKAADEPPLLNLMESQVMEEDKPVL